MKRIALLALFVVVALGVAACGNAASPTGPGGTPTTGQPTKVDPYAAIPTDGAHEKAALDAVPAALDYAMKTTKDQGREEPDLSAGTPTLVSYTLQAEVGKKICLFEVRGDGKAYELYRYPAAPDPSKLFWQDAALNEGARVVDPEGTGEVAAATAVKKIVEEAAAGETVTVKIYGYNFYWIQKDGTPVTVPGGSPFSLSIDPSGAAGSWTM